MTIIINSLKKELKMNTGLIIYLNDFVILDLIEDPRFPPSRE